MMQEVLGSRTSTSYFQRSLQTLGAFACLDDEGE